LPESGDVRQLSPNSGGTVPDSNQAGRILPFWPKLRPYERILVGSDQNGRIPGHLARILPFWLNLRPVRQRSSQNSKISASLPESSKDGKMIFLKIFYDKIHFTPKQTEHKFHEKFTVNGHVGDDGLVNEFDGKQGKYSNRTVDFN
jgi:hypothetical protein